MKKQITLFTVLFCSMYLSSCSSKPACGEGAYQTVEQGIKAKLTFHRDAAVFMGAKQKLSKDTCFITGKVSAKNGLGQRKTFFYDATLYKTESNPRWILQNTNLYRN